MTSNTKLYYTMKGSGKQTVVFLHGLWGGGNYFRELNILDNQTFTQYFPDELGFGKSPKPDISYTLQTRMDALYDSLPYKKYSIVAHSFGTILAIHFANQYPQNVEKLILISPILYRTKHEARHYLSSTFITKLTFDHPILAKIICKSLCSTTILGKISPFFVTQIKREFMGGCIEHSWHSYYSSFLESYNSEPHAPLLQDVSQKIPTVILYGTDDTYLSRKTMDSLEAKRLKKNPIEGTHALLFEKFNYCKSFIENSVSLK